MTDEILKKRALDVTVDELTDAIISKLNLNSPKQKECDKEEFLTPKQVKEKYDVSLSTLWRWNKQNYLKHYEFGCKRLYRISDIEKLLTNLNNPL